MDTLFGLPLLSLRFQSVTSRRIRFSPPTVSPSRVDPLIFFEERRQRDEMSLPGEARDNGRKSYAQRRMEREHLDAASSLPHLAA